MAVEGLDHLDGGAGAGVTSEVDAVDVHRVRQAQVVGDPGERLDDLAWGDAVADHLVVKLADVAAPLPVLHSAGVHHLDGVTLACAEQPGDVVASPFRLLVGDGLHDEMVVAHDDEGAVVQVGRVLELLVGVTHDERGGRRLHHRGVSELRVQVASRVGGRDGAARAGPHAVRVSALVTAVVLRTHLAARVDLPAYDVRVDVDAAGHHDQAGGVHHLRLVAVDLGGRDDAAVLHPDVADLAVLAVLRVIDPASEDAQHHVTASMIRSRTSSSVTLSVEITRLSGMGTLSMR